MRFLLPIAFLAAFVLASTPAAAQRGGARAAARDAAGGATQLGETGSPRAYQFGTPGTRWAPEPAQEAREELAEEDSVYDRNYVYPDERHPVRRVPGPGGPGGPGGPAGPAEDGAWRMDPDSGW